MAESKLPKKPRLSPDEVRRLKQQKRRQGKWPGANQRPETKQSR